MVKIGLDLNVYTRDMSVCVDKVMFGPSLYFGRVHAVPPVFMRSVSGVSEFTCPIKVNLICVNAMMDN